MAKRVGKLNPFDLNDINGAKAVVDTADEAIALWQACGDCGVDVQPYIEQANAYRDFCQKVIDHFGTDASDAGTAKPIQAR